MRVMRRLRNRLHDERGFSLTELLVAVTIGMVILMAAFMVLDRTISSSAQIADRTEALQRGRTAMDLMARELRSQVCLGTTKPIVSASDTSVQFYSDLSSGNPMVIKRRTITYSSSTNKITEAAVTGTGTYPGLSFTGAAVNTTVLGKAKQVMDGSTARPIFRYYGYQTGTTNGTLVQLNPASPTDLGRVAMIRIAFRSYAERPIAQDPNSATIENDVYVRVAVPTQNQGAPECI
jgi:prepilin-type N-terminal cleavage/methylation domain-containing protein